MSLRSSVSRLLRRRPEAPPPPPRLSILQRALTRLGAQRYLEIGVDDGRVLTNLVVRERIGVDPVSPAPAVTAACEHPGTFYFQMTSDAFFEREADARLRGGVDVVFVDGLHTFQQAYRDCLSALRYLSPGGIVFMHDCLPASAAEETPADSYAAAAALAPPGWNVEWTGDVWKAIAQLRSQHRDLQTEVFDCDHGLGVVRRGVNAVNLHLTPDEIASLKYDDLVARKNELLGLRPGVELPAFIDSLPPVSRT